MLVVVRTRAASCGTRTAPFDTRWLYWEAETKLLDERRAEYRPHVFEGNLWLSSSRRIRKGESEPQTAFTHSVASYHLIERVSNWFPAWLQQDSVGTGGSGTRSVPNLTLAARRYLVRHGLAVEDLFYFVLATLHHPSYRETNAGALRMDWPRIPLPGWSEEGRGDAATLTVAVAARGRELAQLLDPETSVAGVTTGALRSDVAAIAVPTTLDGHQMTGDDFAVTAGWGHFGVGQAVMPGQGRAVERSYTGEEQAALTRRPRSARARSTSG